MEYIGRIPVKVGVAVAPTIRQVNVDEKTTTKILKHADGDNGVARGQSEWSWSLTCSLLKDKQILLDLMEAAEASGELTLTLDVGARQYMLINCARSGNTMSSDSDGSADLTITGVAPKMLRTK